MAEASKRSSGNTDLYVGKLKATVGLFPTAAKPTSASEFETAGPNGGELRYERRGVASETAEGGAAVPVQSDPLADHAPESAERAAELRHVADVAGRMADATVPGEFRQVLVEEGSGQVVEPDQVRKGVRLEDGTFVDCTDQLAAIVERTKLDRMDVVACIDGTRIRRERVIGSYFIGAQDKRATPVLRLLYEALRARREVAVVKYSVRTRQQLGVLVPQASTGTLVLLQLVFTADWREAPAKATAIQAAGVSEQQVEVMGAILEALHATPDVLDDLSDDALRLREELLARAVNGEMEAEVVEPLPEVDDEADLAAALAESIAAVRAGRLSAGKV